ncbi:MAG: hypothetical protein CMH57_03035 [Myxococcales bacterium]|nr:hypothetical protein [Myxococcales bacterium]
MTRPRHPPTGRARVARYLTFGAKQATWSLTRAQRSPAAVTFMAEMKGLPQKLGQLLATRNDTLHRRYEALLVQGAPLDDASVLPTLHDTFGPRADALTATLSRVASTSLAQVYRGHLSDGAPVAVKIQCPGIERALTADVQNLRRLVRLIAPLMPASSRSDPAALRQLAHDLGAALLRELDYPGEAQRLRRLGEALGRHPGIRCPLPVDAWCGPRVLTTTWIEGRDWIAAMRDADAEQRARTLRQLATAWLSAGFETGLLHADPHPGNLLACGPAAHPLEATALLDFGQVLEAPAPWWAALQTVITSARARDLASLPGAYRALGFEADWVARVGDALLPLSESLLAPFVASGPFDLQRWNPGPVIDETMANHPIQLPWSLVLVQRTFQGLFAYAKRFDVVLDWGAIADRAFRREPGFTDSRGRAPSGR